MRSIEERGERVLALEEKPELDGYELWHFKAFKVLSASRQAGFGQNPITLSDMLAYMQIHGINDPDDREDFVFFMQEMDDEYIKHVNKK